MKFIYPSKWRECKNIYQGFYSLFVYEENGRCREGCPHSHLNVGFCIMSLPSWTLRCLSYTFLPSESFTSAWITKKKKNSMKNALQTWCVYAPLPGPEDGLWLVNKEASRWGSGSDVGTWLPSAVGASTNASDNIISGFDPVGNREENGLKIEGWIPITEKCKAVFNFSGLEEQIFYSSNDTEFLNKFENVKHWTWYWKH